MFLLKSRKNTRRRKNCLLSFNEKEVAITLMLQQQQLVSLALALATLNRVGNAVALVCNASSRNEFTITQRQSP